MVRGRIVRYSIGHWIQEMNAALVACADCHVIRSSLLAMTNGLIRVRLPAMVDLPSFENLRMACFVGYIRRQEHVPLAPSNPLPRHLGVGRLRQASFRAR